MKDGLQPKIFLTEEDDGHLKMDDEMGKLLFGDPKFNQEIQRGKMKGLKITELEEGKIYWCQLSDRKVLYHKECFIGEPYEKHIIRVFTESGYQDVTPLDYQLTEYKLGYKHAYVNNMNSTDNNCLICNLPETKH